MIIETMTLLILISINGIFSGAEVAFLSIDKIKLRDDIKNNKDAKIVANLLEDTNKFLATIQVAITFAGFLASAFAADSYTNVILGAFNIQNTSIIRPIILIIITILLSFITLVFGELIPKKIGLSNPNKIAYKTAKILIISRKIFAPFVYLLTKSVEFISKVFKIKDIEEEVMTEERIKKVIGLGKEEGILEVKETDILLNVFEFNDTTAKTAMTKIDDMVKININDDKNKIIKMIKKYKFTRYPVFEDSNIIGILNIKDFILNHDKKIIDLIRKPLFVRTTDKIDDIFLMMKKNNTGMMIVKDKVIEGLITTEDILEELVGNIEDEFN